MNIKETLTEMYNQQKEDSCSPPKNKLQYLGDYIFDFTTYDSNATELFAKNMLEVIDVIINQTQFEYIKDEAKYLNYLTMVNMPFLSNKIEWGTSIRGAWFDEYGHPADKVNHYKFDFDLKIDKKKINVFMKELIEWSNI